jgi:hydroxyacyl-ACP dehydratase HTD2-like protein with hotdog domain
MMLNKLAVSFHKLNLEEKQDIVYREEDASIGAPIQAATRIEIAPDV